MTNEELFTDLKQFIEATVSQKLVDVASKDDIKSLKADVVGLKADVKALDEKLDAIQDAIADTLTHTTEITDAAIQDHEQRLRRLEHRSA
jgi:seryl-tRNA synthetase